MKYFCLLIALCLFTACKKEEKDKELKTKDASLSFTTAYYEQTSAPCKNQCTSVSIEVPVVTNYPPVDDTINNKVFKEVRKIVYAGEKPTEATSYEEITHSFTGSYEDMVKKFPNEALIPWEARIKGSITYQSENLLNIKINNYMFTGGAHGYEGDASLLFDLNKGISLNTEDLFTDLRSFTALAETKFREQFRIPANKNINSTGMFFEDEKFVLPRNIFFTDKGLLLQYNAYEAASYADGPKKLLIPYSIANDYLRIK